MGMKQRLQTLAMQGKFPESLSDKAYTLWLNELKDQFSKMDATWRSKSLQEALNDEDALVRNEDLYIGLTWNKAGQQFQQFVRNVFANISQTDDQPNLDDLINILDKVDIDSQRKFAIALASIINEQEYKLIQERLLNKIVKKLDKSNHTKLGEFLRGKELFLALLRERYRCDGQTSTFNSVISYAIREVRKKVESSNEEVNDKLLELPAEIKKGVELGFNSLWFALICHKEFVQLKDKRNREVDEIMKSQKTELNDLYQKQTNAVNELKKTTTDPNAIQKCKAEWDTKIQTLQQQHRQEYEDCNKVSVLEVTNWMARNAIFKDNLPNFDELQFAELPKIIKETCHDIYVELEKELPNAVNDNNNSTPTHNLLTREKLLSYMGSIIFLRFTAELFERYPNFASSHLKESNPELFKKLNASIREICGNTFQVVLQRCANDIGFPSSAVKEKTDNWKKFFCDAASPLIHAQKNQNTGKERLVEFFEECAGLTQDDLNVFCEMQRQNSATPICQTTDVVKALKEQETKLQAEVSILVQKAELLLNEIANKHQNQTSNDKERELFIYIRNKDEVSFVDKIKFLKEKRNNNYSGSLFEIDFSFEIDNQNLLLAAINNGFSFETLKLLAVEHADWKQQSNQYVFAAVNSQNLQAIRWLRAFVVDLNHEENSNTPLSFAIQQYIATDFRDNNWFKVISYLMANVEADVKAFDCHADPNKKVGEEQFTILHLIAQHITMQNWERVKPLLQFLLQNKTHIDLKDHAHNSAFNLFLQNCFNSSKTTQAEKDFVRDVAVFFVASGANISLVNYAGQTPYLLLTQNGFSDLANELFKIYNENLNKTAAPLRKSSSGEKTATDNASGNNNNTKSDTPSVVATKQSIFLGSNRERKSSGADLKPVPLRPEDEANNDASTSNKKDNRKSGLIGSLKKGASGLAIGKGMWKPGKTTEEQPKGSSPSPTAQ